MKKIIRVGLTTYRVFNDNEMDVFSGYATLYLLMAMVPFFTLVVGAINFLPESYLQSFADVFVNLFPNIPQIRWLANEMISRVNPQAGTLVISISAVTILWSASKGVSAVQNGLLKISGIEQSAVMRKLSALIYTVLMILLIPALLIFRVLRGSLRELTLKLADMLHMQDFGSAFLTLLEDSGLFVIIATALVVVFSYTFMQGYTRSFKKQLPGALFTTVLWMLASSLFEWFISEFWSASSVYGSFASIFLTAMWLKIIMKILFLGASLNEALILLSASPDSEPSSNCAADC